MIDVPTIGFLITTGLLDSINPFAIEALLFVIAAWLALRKSPAKITALGFCYILAFFIVNLLAGFGLLAIFKQLPPIILQCLTIIIGALVIIAGLIELKEFFIKSQPHLRFPKLFRNTIKQLTSKPASYVGIFILGFYMAFVELLCTGAPYVGALSVFKNYPAQDSFWLIIIYNIITILPILLVVLLAVFGFRISAVQKWADESKKLLRLGAGTLLILLGWLLMLIANGVMNFG